MVHVFSRISRNFSREMGQIFSHLARNQKREKCACLPEMPITENIYESIYLKVLQFIVCNCIAMKQWANLFKEFLFNSGLSQNNISTLLFHRNK